MDYIDTNLQSQHKLISSGTFIVIVKDAETNKVKKKIVR
jgi:hypothetical protein